MKIDRVRNAPEIRQLTDWSVPVTMGGLASVSLGVPLWVAVVGCAALIRPWDQTPGGALWQDRTVQLVFWTLAFMGLFANWPGYVEGVTGG